MSNPMPVMAGKNPPPPKWRPHIYPSPECQCMTLRWRNAVLGRIGAVNVECINPACRATLTRAQVMA